MRLLTSKVAMVFVAVMASTIAMPGFFHFWTFGDTTDQNTGDAASANKTTPPVLCSANGVHQDGGNTMVPSQDFQIYHGAGYVISIPSGWIYSKSSIGEVTWYPADMTQVIGIRSEPETPTSQIRRLQEAQLTMAEQAKTKLEMTPVTVTHPAVKGATATTMFEHPIYPPGSHGVYLFVTGRNGNIYLVYGLSQEPNARVSVLQIIGTFCIMPL
jgi:hypothetical protein